LVALQSLYASLYVKEKPINGTWIPTWLVRATGTEARAAVLAELLWWFEPAFSDARRQERASSSNRTAKLRARARVYDAGGLQWLAISIRRLAARTMLSASTTAGALRWLKSEGLLAVEPGKNRIIRIRPNGRAIAQAFFSATHSEVAQHEFLHPDATRTEWTGSMTQSEAMHRAPGVTVHNVFVSAFGGDHFRARLLCQILFRFLDRRGHCAAVTKIGDEVWWVTTDRQLAEELGVGAKKVRRGLDALIRDGLVHKLIRPSGFRSGGERRWVVHLRPDMPNIQRVIESFHGTAAPSSKGETL